MPAANELDLPAQVRGHPTSSGVNLFTHAGRTLGFDHVWMCGICRFMRSH